MSILYLGVWLRFGVYSFSLCRRSVLHEAHTTEALPPRSQNVVLYTSSLFCLQNSLQKRPEDLSWQQHDHCSIFRALLSPRALPSL